MPVQSSAHHHSWLLAIALCCLLGLAVGVTATSVDAAEQCTRDSECNDRSFCNGVERCQPGTSGADARGCVADRNPVCRAGQFCNEETDRCVAETACPDRDGDGARAMYCGGDDCDDNDPNRYPGNIERWDNRNHDEDCDDSTSGVAALSGSQAPQICSGREVMVLSTPHQIVSCISGTVCIPQPNGSGICGVVPAGYVEPAKIDQPPGQQTGKPKPTLPKPLTDKPKLKIKEKD